MNEQYHSDASVVILAAGESRRMTKPKLFLKYNDKITFIEHIINVYLQFGCEEIVLVLNAAAVEPFNSIAERNKYQIKLVINVNLEHERFYSAKLGILNISKSKYIFLQDVDNPFVNLLLLESLYSVRLDTAYVVPMYYGKGGHPILLGDSICRYIRSINFNNANLKMILRKFNRIEINTDDRNVLTNINTIDDYQKYFKV